MARALSKRSSGDRASAFDTTQSSARIRRYITDQFGKIDLRMPDLVCSTFKPRERQQATDHVVEPLRFGFYPVQDRLRLGMRFLLRDLQSNVQPGQR